jgi:ketosteroid isomerase-like protein
MKHAHIAAACRKAFTGFERNDKTDLIALLADDVVFEFSDSLPYGGTYHGKAEFLAFWKHVYQKWESFNYDARAVLEADDYIIVPVIARAKALNGYSMENEHLFLFQIRDGRIVHGRLYADTARGRDILEDRPVKHYAKMILA